MINGWRLLSTPIFNKLYQKLVIQVVQLREKQPDHYKNHPKTKLLASIQRVLKEVSKNPDSPEYRLGRTLGKRYGHWRRVKKIMPPRYRLFFRFHSNYCKSFDSRHNKCIIFAWFNDELSLRKKGAKSDVYVTFKRLLLNRTIPDNWDKLLSNSEEIK